MMVKVEKSTCCRRRRKRPSAVADHVLGFVIPTGGRNLGLLTEIDPCFCTSVALGERSQKPAGMGGSTAAV